MEQAVKPAHVHERAVVGQVLDDTGEHCALFEVRERHFLLGVLLFLEDLLAGDHHVAALLVQLDDADFELRAQVAVQVAHRAHFHLRAGQERLQADVDHQAALDAAQHDALDRDLGVRGFFQRVPNFVAQRLVVADEVAAFLLLTFHDHFHLVADVELRRAGVVQHLLQRDHTLGLQADIDHHMLVGDLDHRAGDDRLFRRHRLRGVLLGSLFAVEAFEGARKILSVVLRLGVA